ncbi:MAG: T9SS type A sorting domain-containing protein [Bacteroidota bacterium]
MRKWISVLALFLIVGRVTAQDDGWVRTFGGPRAQNSLQFHLRSDGVSVVFGQENPEAGIFFKSIKWYRIAANGDLLSEVDLYGFGNTLCRDMLALSDDRFWVVGGSARGTETDYRPFLLEVNSYGERQWQRMYEYLGTGTDSAYNPLGEVSDIDRMPDGDVLLSGFGIRRIPPVRWLNLMRVDDKGNIKWHRIDSSQQINNLIRSAVDGNGNIYTTTWGRVELASPPVTFLTKRNANGEVLWRKQLVDRSEEMLIWDIIVNDRAEAILVGEVPEGQSGQLALLLRIDSAGDVRQFERIQVDNWPFSRVLSVVQAADGGYVLGGDVEGIPTNGAPPIDAWIRKLHPGFGREWERVFAIGPGTTDMIISTKLSESGEVLACGSSLDWSDLNKGADCLLLRLGANGDLAANECAREVSKTILFPNPAHESTFLQISDAEPCIWDSDKYSVQLYDLLGREIVVPQVVVSGKLRLDLARVQMGGYVVQIARDGEVIDHLKLVKSR